MTEPPPRILILGAHPDDADIKAGGSAAQWCARGFVVKMVSMTNGQSGHQSVQAAELARRRKAEAQASAAVIGASYDVLDHPDGALLPTLETRSEVIRLIRRFNPDLLLTHRPNDYHPDHRYTALLVQDAAYLVTVPALCPDVPHLMRNPIIMYLSDSFQKPNPFEAHVAVDIEPELDQLIAMLHCHQSQFYEWLPYNAGYLAEVPADDQARKAWLGARIRRRLRPLADRCRALLVRTYGPERGNKIQYVEAFEVSEYGSPLDEASRARLFPFLPNVAQGSAAAKGRQWVDMPQEE